MKKFKGANWKKRVLAAAMAVGMVLTMITASDWANIANAAGSGRSENLLFQDQGKALRTRAVLDDLPIPADKRSGAEYDAWIANWQSGEKGTYDRPFMILELVPYYEQGNFGWLIDGCEPIDVDRLRGNTTQMSGIKWLEAQNFFTVNQIDYTTYFFPGETEGRREFYTENNTYKFNETTWESMKKTDAKQFHGYWEVVENKTGTHRITTDPGNGWKHIVAANNMVSGEEGNLVWHTTDNKFTKDHMKAAGFDLDDETSVRWYMTFEQIQMGGGNIDEFIDYLKLNTIGSRYYTTRTAGTHDPYLEIPAYSMYDYQSKDVFVRDTIGKSLKYDKTNVGSSTQEYSVWIKTITPEELNNNPQWVDLADLVFVQRFNHTTAIADLYKTKDAGGQYYNRFMKSPVSNAFEQSKSVFGGTYDNNDYPGYAGKRKDITWSVAAKLLKRVAATRNFIGIVFDKTVRDQNAADTKSVTYYRYELDDTRIEGDNFGQQGYKDNIFKLWTICTSTKPNLTQRFYINSGKIVEDANGYGVFAAETNRTADEAMYWSPLSFFCASSIYPDVQLNQIDANTTYWEDYTGYFNNTAYVNYVQGHTYTYSGDQALYQNYEVGGKAGADPSHFDDFNHYVTTNSKTKDIYSSVYSKGISGISSETAPPWIAIRYILELDVDADPNISDDLYVLDVEPSVGLGTDRKPVWKLTENDVALMVPSISADAKIEINHMISGSFVGRNEDLNSTYDLIYIGDDASGFWSGQDVKDQVKAGRNNNNVWKNSVAAAGLDRTDFVDDSMDGLVYFHIGDLFTVNSGFKPNFIYDVEGGKYIYDAYNEHTVNTGSTTRQPSNDFTSIKVKEIKSYVKADYPVVAASTLFTTGAGTRPYVDQSSLLWGLLSTTRAALQSDGTYTNGIFKENEVSGIDERVRNRKNSQMKITGTPVLYDSNDKDNTYLPKDGVYGVLKFGIEVPNATDYSYRIYLDQDRNGKFTSEEIVQTNALTSKVSSPTAYVTDGWVGFIQWKIEVYKTANPDSRISKTGCSAIKAKEDDKNKILALQIIPEASDVDLSTHNGNGTPNSNNTWKNLYKFCTDFEIEVYKVKLSEFEKLFRKGVNGDGDSYGFSYDMAKDINTSDTEILSNTNPRRDILELVEKQTEHENLKNTLLGGHTLSEFNMIVIGFKDSYNSKDFSNKYGCAEYLFYFADKGRSILFTHDLAHYRNEAGWDVGRSATTMLRDIMGMNRYGMVSYRLVNDVDPNHNYNTDRSSRLAKSLAAYNAKKGIPFESTTSPYKQAYTYANLMSKVGQNAGGDRRGMYKNAIIHPKDGTTNIAVGSGGNFGNTLAQTNRVVRLNEGQITQYPYNIDEVLAVNDTHYQYYQLNMEDPELTVWFTLEDPFCYGGSTTQSGGKYELVYAVTPQEAANNYYIYSKGNIFYSGVGHSGISGDAERKLFVNTLIAAYRPTLQEPEIIVTNTEAVREGKKYTIRIDQEFDYNDAGERILSSSLSGDYEVFFIPRDYSGAPTLKCRIYYEGETQFYGESAGYKIYKATLNGEGKKVRGAELGAADKVPGVEHTYLLNTEQEYVIVYDKARLGTGDARNHIIFEAKNDRVEAPSKTDLYFKPRPLFILD